jgi:protein-S-isoprenylcysteine O-methyltransferase Ste14
MPLMLATIALAPWLGSLADGAVRIAAIAMLAAGILLVVWSRATLGRSFTPFPRPVDEGNQVSTGPYEFVRHPIYSAVVLALAGWALLWQSTVAGVFVVALAILFDFKARREEAWLAQAYEGYAEYRRRVRKFIPLVY